jgi:hypothetical protein
MHYRRASGLVQTGAMRPEIPAEGSGVTIRIRYRILNARLAAGAVSGGGGSGLRRMTGSVPVEFQQWVEAVYKRRCVIGGWLAGWRFSIVGFRRLRSMSF